MSTESKSKAVRSYSVFGPRPLLEGEDEAGFDEFYGRVYAAVKPTDIIDEMFIDDVVYLEWEILRSRRSKLNLMRQRGLEALQDFLRRKLGYKDCRKQFVDVLSDYIKNRQEVSRDQSENPPRKLARGYVRNEPDAVDEVNEALGYLSRTIDDVLDEAKFCKAQELADKYRRREPVTVNWITKLLAAAGMSIESLMVKVLPKELDRIERIDRLITIAENRRNGMLREIDRRRAVLGEALRRQMQEVEGEFEVIEKPPEAKNAA